MELLVVVAIVGILSAIAYPSYLSYVQRANRSDATRVLMLYSQAFERCYSQNFTYVGCAAVPAATLSPNRYYNVAATNVTATDYTLTAVPAGPPQNDDTLCTSFTLQGSAGQSATGAAPNASQFCWGAN